MSQSFPATLFGSDPPVAINPTYFFENTGSSPQTVTLPAPSANALVYVKDTAGNAQTNNITINHHASENIDGSSSLKITFNYGFVLLTSDGANWFVVSRSSNQTAWGTSLISCTPNGFGTVSGLATYSRRMGDSIHVRCVFTSGTVSAGTTASLSINLNLDTTKLGSSVLPLGFGIGGSSALVNIWAAGNGTFSFYDGSTANAVFVTVNESGPLAKANGNAFNSTQQMNFEFIAPISGWDVY